jgi:ribosomal protein S18 acetylase RimI-like enzyme
MLLVVPRSSSGGRALARKRRGHLHHSEHALELRERPDAAGASADRPDALELLSVTRADLDTVSALMLDGFGSGEIVAERVLSNARTRTLMIALEGDVTGTISLALEGERGGVYGFVIGSAHRGRGLGSQALRAACRDLFEAGARTVGLEVAVDNERALRLYSEIGFRPVTTEDYYEVR